MRHILYLTLLAILTACTHNDTTTLSSWQPGNLDIHFIYTGRGESSFMIMPDGTTMFIDAGDWDPAPETYSMMCEAMPDTTRRSGEWISRYIDRVNPNKGHIDYLMVSHFHKDHMGDVSNPAPMTEGRDPDYKLVGIARVGEDNIFGHVIDRGYPNYNYPREIDDPHTNNYRTLINWQKKRFGIEQERFVPGAINQIALVHDPKKYDGRFSIRNLAANGEICFGDSTIRCYDLNEANLNSNNENTRSIAVRVDYGPFSYYTGGDIAGRLLDADGNKFQVDSLVALACSEVDVCKTNHHGYLDSMTKGFLDNIRARHYIMHVWDWQHTQPSVLSRITETRAHTNEPLIFYGNIPDTLLHKYSEEPWLSNICPNFGHIVVRTEDGGSRYSIYVIDAKDESMHILAAYGPFDSDPTK